MFLMYRQRQIQCQEKYEDEVKYTEKNIMKLLKF